MLSDGLDGVEGAFSHNGILLVCQLLLEHLDSPRGANVSEVRGGQIFLDFASECDRDVPQSAR